MCGCEALLTAQFLNRLLARPDYYQELRISGWRDAVHSGLTCDDMVHMPMLGVSTSGCPILILFLKLDNFQPCQLGLLVSKERHRRFWRIPGIMYAKELPNKDPTRFQSCLEADKDCGELLFVY